MNTSESEDEIIEEILKKVEPKGAFNFLNLDEVEVYKNQVFADLNPSLFVDNKIEWNERKKINDRSQEFTVAGLITEYEVERQP
ncbi:hypothetical protein [Halpernia sp. GG3]